MLFLDQLQKLYYPDLLGLLLKDEGLLLEVGHWLVVEGVVEDIDQTGEALLFILLQKLDDFFVVFVVSPEVLNDLLVLVEVVEEHFDSVLKLSHSLTLDVHQAFRQSVESLLELLFFLTNHLVPLLLDCKTVLQLDQLSLQHMYFAVLEFGLFLKVLYYVGLLVGPRFFLVQSLILAELFDSIVLNGDLFL